MFENEKEETQEQSFMTTLALEATKAAVISAATIAGMYGGMMVVGWFVSKKQKHDETKKEQ